MIQYFSKIEIESIKNNEKLSTYIHLSPNSNSGIFQVHYLKIIGFQITNKNIHKLLTSNLNEIDIESQYIIKNQSYSNLFSSLRNFIDLKAVHSELLPFNLNKNINDIFLKNNKIFDIICDNLNDKDKLYLDGIMALSDNENEPNFNLGMKYLIKGGKNDSEPCLNYLLLGCLGFLNLENSNYPLACSIFVQTVLNTGLLHNCGKYIFSPILEIFCKGLDNLQKFRKYILERVKEFTKSVSNEENLLNFHFIFKNKQIEIENIIIYLLIQPNRKSRNWKNCFRLILKLIKYESCSHLFIFLGDILRLFNNNITINVSFLNLKISDYLFKSKNFKILSIYLLNELIENNNYLENKISYKIKKFSFKIIKKYDIFNSEFLYMLLYLTTYGLNPDLATIFNTKILKNLTLKYEKNKKLKYKNFIEKIISNVQIDFKAINVLLEILIINSKEPGFLFSIECAKICNNYKLMELIISCFGNKIKCNKSKLAYSLFLYEDQPSIEQISNSIDVFIDLFNEYKENYKIKNNYNKNILKNEFELKITKYYALYRLFTFIINFLLDSKFKEITIDFYLSTLGMLLIKFEYYFWEKKMPKIINLYVLGKLLKIGKYDSLSYNIHLLCLSIPRNDLTSRFFKSKALNQLLINHELSSIIKDLNVIYGYFTDNTDFQNYQININNLFSNLIDYYEKELNETNHIKNINHQFWNYLYELNNYKTSKKESNFGTNQFLNFKDKQTYSKLINSNIFKESKKIMNTLKNVQYLHGLSEIYKELDIRMIFGKYSNIIKIFDHQELLKNYRKDYTFNNKELFNFHIIEKYLKSDFKDFNYEVFRYIELIKNNELLRVYKNNEVEIDENSKIIKLGKYEFYDGWILKNKQNIKVFTQKYGISEIDLLILNIKFLSIYNPIFLRVIGIQYKRDHKEKNKCLVVNYIFEYFDCLWIDNEINSIEKFNINLLKILYAYFMTLITVNKKSVCKLEYLVTINGNVKIFNPYFITEFENNLNNSNGFTYCLDPIIKEVQEKNNDEDKDENDIYLKSNHIIFDFGYILYYLINKKPLYDNNDASSKNFVSFDLKIKKIAQKFDFYKKIIYKCVQLDMNERISFDKLINMFDKKTKDELTIYSLNNSFFFPDEDSLTNKIVHLPNNLSIINSYNKGINEYTSSKIYYKNEAIINGKFKSENFKNYYLIINENKTINISSLKHKIIIIKLINKLDMKEENFEIYVNHISLNLLNAEQYAEYVKNFEESTNLKKYEKWFLKNDEANKTLYDKVLEYFRTPLIKAFSSKDIDIVSNFNDMLKICVMDLFGNQLICSVDKNINLNLDGGIHLIPSHPKFMFNQFFYNKLLNENLVALLNYESFGFWKITNKINNYWDFIDIIKLNKEYKYIGGDLKEYKYIGNIKNDKFEGIKYNKIGDYHSKYNKFTNFIYYKKYDLLFNGQLKNDIPNGIGELINNNKIIYQGNFVNGIPNGFGILLSKNENLIFKGIFKNGYPNYGWYINQLKVYEGIFLKKKKKINSLKNIFKVYKFFKDDFKMIGSVSNFNNKILRISGIMNKDNNNLLGNYEIYTKDSTFFIGRIENNIKKGYGILFCNNNMIIKGYWNHPFINGIIDFNKDKKSKENYIRLENEYQKTMHNLKNLDLEKSFNSIKEFYNEKKNYQDSINIIDKSEFSSIKLHHNLLDPSNMINNNKHKNISINNINNSVSFKENSINTWVNYKFNNEDFLKCDILDLDNPNKIKGLFNFTSDGNIIFKKYGEIYLNNNYIYLGEFYKNIIHGFGLLIFNDGSFYKGQFDQNKIIGFGIYKKSNYEYYGEFKNGKLHGFGIQKYNKKVIEGLWVENQLKFYNLYFKKEYNNLKIKNLILDFSKNNNYCHIIYKYNNIINNISKDLLIKFKKYFKKHINSSKFKINWINKELHFYGQIDKSFKLLKGLIFMNKLLLFQGEIDIKLENGFGVVIDNKNNKFEKLGYIRNFNLNGLGLLSTANNSKQGKFVSDLAEGIVLTKINDQEIYKGYYKNGKKQGYAIKFIEDIKKFCYFDKGELKNIYLDYN